MLNATNDVVAMAAHFRNRRDLGLRVGFRFLRGGMGDFGVNWRGILVRWVGSCGGVAVVGAIGRLWGRLFLSGRGQTPRGQTLVWMGVAVGGQTPGGQTLVRLGSSSGVRPWLGWGRRQGKSVSFPMMPQPPNASVTAMQSSFLPGSSGRSTLSNRPMVPR